MNTVHKKIEIVGTSGASIDDAIESAIRCASATLRDLEWFEVDEIRGRIADGGVHQYQVTLKVGFRLDEREVDSAAGASLARSTIVAEPHHRPVS